VKWRDSEFVPCDPAGEQPDWQNDCRLDTLPQNNRLVIYELPTRWSRMRRKRVTTTLNRSPFRDMTREEPCGEGSNPR